MSNQPIDFTMEQLNSNQDLEKEYLQLQIKLNKLKMETMLKT